MSDTKLTPQQAADDLRGTCKSLHEVVRNGEDNDLAWCGELDELVAECSSCGWWVEAYDCNDSGECEDCADAQED